MIKRKTVFVPKSNMYSRSDDYTLDSGRVITRGEVIKVEGISDIKFKFKEHVINNDSGREWVDCYELEKGVSCGLRSFRPERIIPISKKKNKNRIEDASCG
jgi:hypothetical protein